MPQWVLKRFNILNISPLNYIFGSAHLVIHLKFYFLQYLVLNLTLWRQYFFLCLFILK